MESYQENMSNGQNPSDEMKRKVEEAKRMAKIVMIAMNGREEELSSKLQSVLTADLPQLGFALEVIKSKTLNPVTRDPVMFYMIMMATQPEHDEILNSVVEFVCTQTVGFMRTGDTNVTTIVSDN